MNRILWFVAVGMTVTLGAVQRKGKYLFIFFLFFYLLFSVQCNIYSIQGNHIFFKHFITRDNIIVRNLVKIEKSAWHNMRSRILWKQTIIIAITVKVSFHVKKEKEYLFITFHHKPICVVQILWKINSNPSDKKQRKSIMNVWIPKRIFCEP